MPVDILDHTCDLSGRETHRLQALYGQPEWVKSASHEQKCGDPEQLPSHIYADPTRKLYPCHTKAATWMSAAFFYDRKSQHDPAKAELIEARILKAADYFACRGDVDALREKINRNVADELTKLSNDDFAVVWNYADGTVDRHWPLRNAKEVQFASQQFAKHRDKFAFVDRHRIANKILDKALEFGAHLEGRDELLDKTAARGGCSARDAAAAFQKRAELTKRTHPDGSAEMQKMAAVILEFPAQARGLDSLIKLAGHLDTYDRLTSLNKLYDAGGLARPEETLFAVGEKCASDFVQAHVETTTGNTYAISDLEKVAVEQVREWMGDEFVEAVTLGDIFVDGTKMAAIVPTLDRGAAAMFDRMMEAAAVQPVIRDKAASAVLRRQDLAALASQYQPQG